MIRSTWYFILLGAILAACSHSSETDFSVISKDRWYSGNINGKELFIRFSDIQKQHATGMAFINSNSPLANTGSIKATEDSLIVRLADLKIDAAGTWQLTPESMTFHPDDDQSNIKFTAQPKSSLPAHHKRYETELFKKVKRSEVTYGHAPGFYQSKPVPDMNAESYPAIISEVLNGISSNLMAEDIGLTMDIYEPDADTCQLRPLLVLIHGGAFIVGDKRDDLQEKFADYFAKRGYVVASVNYRLGYIFLPGAYSNLERCIYKAVQDVRAALRWLVHHKKKYRIDPGHIFLAGNSAGGFIALKTAFMSKDEVYESAEGNLFMLQDDLGCLDCSGNDYKEKFRIKGLISMWGAMTDDEMMDAGEKTPLLLIHGDSDKIVPYSYQFPFRNIDEDITAFFVEKVYGSKPLSNRAEKLGFPVKLITVPSGSHEPQVDEKNRYTPFMNELIQQIDSFVFSLIEPATLKISGPQSVSGNSKVSVYKIKGFGQNAEIFWEVNGGCIVAYENQNKVSVVWFSNASEHSLRVGVKSRNEKLLVSDHFYIKLN